MPEESSDAADRRFRTLRWETIDPGARAALLAYAVSFVLVAGVAWWLEPDARGVGTHQQLGFAPCATHALLGLPCPFCGMTTAFACMADGDVRRAFFVQPAGALGFIAGAAATPLAVLFAALGRWPHALPRILRSRATFLAGAAVVALAWAYKIAILR